MQTHTHTHTIHKCAYRWETRICTHLYNILQCFCCQYMEACFCHMIKTIKKRSFWLFLKIMTFIPTILTINLIIMSLNLTILTVTKLSLAIILNKQCVCNHIILFFLFHQCQNQTYTLIKWCFFLIYITLLRYFRGNKYILRCTEDDQMAEFFFRYSICVFHIYPYIQCQGCSSAVVNHDVTLMKSIIHKRRTR